jgi:hypothetical protein
MNLINDNLALNSILYVMFISTPIVVVLLSAIWVSLRGIRKQLGESARK